MSVLRGRTAGRGARGGRRRGGGADVPVRRPRAGLRTKSTATDPVSEADLAAEAEIRRVLGERRPGDAILGEEGGAERRRRAAVDRRSARRDRQLPLRDPAVRGQRGLPGPRRHDRRRRPGPGARGDVRRHPLGPAHAQRRRRSPAPRARTSATALVSTGFAYDADVRAKQAVVIGRVLPRVRDIRRAGSAALDLAWCACGRYDAYYERGVNLWDYAAGGADRLTRRPRRARAGRRRRRPRRPGGGAAAARSTSSWA